ncbi:MAG: sporulation protein YtfJ [Clostridia bacterium]|jgi:sporulation protein YtfJ|nr:sporulation protein YtfJ [Clostridia bacterium]
MASDNKIQEILSASLENIRSMVDANTVIGTPINTPSGTVIIPVSKISMGIASGGIDYAGKSEEAIKSKLQNFGGGGGTGLSVTPVGFLVVTAEGRVDMINVGIEQPSGTIEQVADVIERSPDIIAKIKALFGKKKNEVAEVEKEKAAEPAEPEKKTR